jgi:hypothetical protein
MIEGPGNRELVEELQEKLASFGSQVVLVDRDLGVRGMGPQIISLCAGVWRTRTTKNDVPNQADIAQGIGPVGYMMESSCVRPLAAVRPRPCRERRLARPPGRGLPVRAGSGAGGEQQCGGVLGDVHDLPWWLVTTLAMIRCPSGSRTRRGSLSFIRLI